MRFASGHDANLYLSGSIVRGRGKPIYVEQVMGNEVIGYVIGRMKNRISLSLDELDLTPFKLGYVYDDANDRCRYMERIPARKWRQGVTRDNTKELNNPRYRLPLDNMVVLRKLLVGKYPSVESAFAKAVKLRTEIPFDHRFSIDFTGKVRFKTRKVGSWADGKFSLTKKYVYLKEMLEAL